MRLGPRIGERDTDKTHEDEQAKSGLRLGDPSRPLNESASSTSVSRSSGGLRLGPTPAEVRSKRAADAERQAKLTKLMGPSGTLGGMFPNRRVAPPADGSPEFLPTKAKPAQVSTQPTTQPITQPPAIANPAAERIRLQQRAMQDTGPDSESARPVERYDIDPALKANIDAMERMGAVSREANRLGISETKNPTGGRITQGKSTTGSGTFGAIANPDFDPNASARKTPEELEREVRAAQDKEIYDQQGIGEHVRQGTGRLVARVASSAADMYEGTANIVDAAAHQTLPKEYADRLIPGGRYERDNDLFLALLERPAGVNVREVHAELDKQPLAGTTADTLGDAFGSTLGFAGTGWLGRALKGGQYTAPMLMGAAVNAKQVYDEAVQYGADPDDADKAVLLSSLVGTSEAVPVGRLFDKFDDAYRIAKGADRASGGQLFGALMRSAIAEGGEEAIQEFGQQVGNNAVIARYIDENRPLLEGTLASAGTGGAVGFTMGLLFSALGMGKVRLETARERKAAFDEAAKMARTMDDARQAAQVDRVSGLGEAAMFDDQAPPTTDKTDKTPDTVQETPPTPEAEAQPEPTGTAQPDPTETPAKGAAEEPTGPTEEEVRRQYQDELKALRERQSQPAPTQEPTDEGQAQVTDDGGDGARLEAQAGQAGQEAVGGVREQEGPQGEVAPAVTGIAEETIDEVRYELYKMRDGRFGVRASDADTDKNIGDNVKIYPDEARAKKHYDGLLDKARAEVSKPASKPANPYHATHERMKSQNPKALVLVRAGDFYETFGEDAKTMSKVLGVTLTSKSGVPMAGVPYHSIEGYLRRLIMAGHRPAIVDQPVEVQPATPRKQGEAIPAQPTKSGAPPAGTKAKSPEKVGKQPWEMKASELNAASDADAELGRRIGVEWVANEHEMAKQTAARLRDTAKELGISPIPTKRDELVRRVIAARHERIKQRARKALAGGRIVPDEVLAKYPDLTDKAETPKESKGIGEKAQVKPASPAEPASKGQERTQKPTSADGSIPPAAQAQSKTKPTYRLVDKSGNTISEHLSESAAKDANSRAGNIHRVEKVEAEKPSSAIEDAMAAELGLDEPEAETKKADAPKADLRIEQYSDKAIIVRGDTKAHKDRIKAMGGKWLGRPKSGSAGWMFPASKRSKVESGLSDLLGASKPLPAGADQYKRFASDFQAGDRVTFLPSGMDATVQDPPSRGDFVRIKFASGNNIIEAAAYNLKLRQRFTNPTPNPETTGVYEVPKSAWLDMIDEAEGRGPAPKPTKPKKKSTPKKPSKASESRKEFTDAIDELGDLLDGYVSMNAPLDPKILAAVGKVAAKAVKAGYYTFAEATQQVYNALKSKFGEAKARRMMEAVSDEYERAWSSIRERAKGKYDIGEAGSVADVIGKAETVESGFDAEARDVILDPDLTSLQKYHQIASMAKRYDMSIKEAQEQTERNLVDIARDIAGRTDLTEKARFDWLVRLYDKQPRFSKRTSTSVRNQAYSTPVPLAFAVSRMAGIESGMTVYEPTAGHGVLLLEADKSKSIVNELGDTRAESLRQQGYKSVTQNDASSYVPAQPYDATVMNPPFGKLNPTVTYQGWNLSKLEHLISVKAIEGMKDDGVAVMILGANKESGKVGAGEKVFINYLMNHHNVVANFEVSGDLYAAQGAAWPVRVIIAVGRKSSPTKKKLASDTVEHLDSWESVYNKISEVRNEVKNLRASLGTQAAGTGRPGLSDGRTDDVSAADDQAEVSGTTGQDAGSSDRGSQRGGQEPQPERAGRPESGERATDRKPRPEQSDVRNRPDEQVERKPDDERVAADSGRPDQDAGESGTEAAEPGRARVSGGHRLGGLPRQSHTLNPVGPIHYEYIPQSKGNRLGTTIPRFMAEGSFSALKELEQRVGPIDEFVRERLGYKTTDEMHKGLAAEQVDAVALAIYQIENGGAQIIGDETGIGKGRQAAALIRYAKRRGIMPVFFTVDPKLFSDMWGDLKDIDTSIKPLIVADGARGSIRDKNNKVVYKAMSGARQKSVMSKYVSGDADAIKGHDAVFVVYSQINNLGSGQQSFLSKLANRQDVMILMDESHNAAGQESTTGVYMRGGNIVVGKKPNQKRATLPGLLNGSGVRGTVYLSATYAKRPDSTPLYFKTSMGRAVKDTASLVKVMEKGGVPMQQVVADELARTGEYVRRERDFSGVPFNIKQHGGDDTTQIVEDIDKTASVLRSIIDFSRMVGDAVSSIADTRATANTESSLGSSDFASVVHNYISQMLLGAKADAVADEAIETIKRGEKPFIALINTMESFHSEFIEESDYKPGDKVDMSFGDVLRRALDRTLRVSEKDAAGNSETYPMKPDDLGLQAEYDAVVDQIESLNVSLPSSPIDWIRFRIEQATGEKIVEITGRTNTFDYAGPGDMTLRRRSDSDKNKNTIINKFNSGEAVGVIANVSGATGVSMHASEKFKDQRTRHMIIAQPSTDIAVFMQMLGRIRRTGMQEGKARYTLFSLPVEAERRPSAVLATKLKSLNANTSADAKSSLNVDSTDMFNKYGDRIVSEYLFHNDDVARLTNIHVEANKSGTVSVKQDVARQMTGRMAVLSNEQQKQIYADIIPAYKELVEQLKETGEYDLEIRVHDDWNAKLLSSDVLEPGSAGGGTFGAGVTSNEYEIKDTRKPPTLEQVNKEYSDNFGNSRQETDRFFEKLDEKLTRIAGTYLGAQPHPSRESDYKKWERDSERLAGYRAEYEDVLQNKIRRNLGRFVAFKFSESGEVFEGVITKLRYNEPRKPSNPYLKSRFTVEVMVTDPVGKLRLPLQAFFNGDVSVQAADGKMSDFDAAQDKDFRVKRTIMTGNPLRALEIAEKGQVVKFKNDAGETITGLLMPRSWSSGDLANDPRKELQGGEAVLYYLENLPYGVPQDSKAVEHGGILRVRYEPYGGGFIFQTPKAKGRGGDYFLDKKITRLIGDFESIGNRMQAVTSDRTKAKKALDYIHRSKTGTFTPANADNQTLIDTANKRAGVKRPVTDKLKDIEDNARKRIDERGEEFGGLDPRSKGGAPIIADLVDYSILIAAKSARLGITKGKKLANEVRRLVKELAPHLSGDFQKVYKNVRRIMEASLNEDGSIDVDRFEIEATLLRKTAPRAKGPTVKKTIAEQTGREAVKDIRKKKIKLSEKDLIRERFKQRMKRERAIEAMKAKMTQQVDRLKKKEVNAAQARKAIVNMVQNNLPAKMRGRYLNVVARAKTARDIENAVNRIRGDLERQARAELVKMVRNAAQRGGITRHEAKLIIRMIYDGATMEQIGQQLQADRVAIKSEPESEAGFYYLPAGTYRQLLANGQDRMREAWEVQKAIEKGTGNAVEEASDVYLAEELRTRKTQNRLERAYERNVRPITQVLGRAGIDITNASDKAPKGDELPSFNTYVIARHAQERNKAMREKAFGGLDQVIPGLADDPNFGSGMADELAQQILDTVDKSELAGEYKRAAKLFDRLNRVYRDVLRESGLESDETIDAWESMFKAYAPLRTDMTALDPSLAATVARTGKGINIRGKEQKTAKGRKTIADDPLGFAWLNLQSGIIRAEKNRVGQTFLRLAEANPNKDVWRILRGDEKPAVGWEVVGVKVKGEEIRIAIAPHHIGLAKALKNLGQVEMFWGLGYLAAGTRTLAALLTRWNPVFPPINLIRDVQGVSLTVTGEHGALDAARVTKNITPAFWALYGQQRKGLSKRHLPPEQAKYWAKMAAEYKASGAPIAFLDLNNLHDAARRLNRELRAAKSGRHPLNTIRSGLLSVTDYIADLNDAAENATRLATYAMLRQKGWTQARAASYAKNISTNFERKGNMGGIINALWYFSNASIQGNARVIESAVRHKGTRKVIGGLFASSITLHLLNYLMAGDDDDGENYYAKMPDYVKRNNIILPLWDDEGNAVMIPAPFVYNFVQSMAQAVTDVAIGQKSPFEGASYIGSAAFETFNPIGGEISDPFYAAVPSVAKPFYEIDRNRDWMQNPIVPEEPYAAYQKPDSELTMKSTPEWLKATAKFMNSISGGNEYESGWLDFSPDSIDHLIKFYTGGLGKTLSRSENVVEKKLTGKPVESHEIPLYRRFRYTTNPRIMADRFYDDYKANIERLQDMKEAKYELDPTQRALLNLRPVMSATEKKIKRLRELRDRNEYGSPEWSAVNDQIHDEFAKFNKRYQDTATKD